VYGKNTGWLAFCCWRSVLVGDRFKVPDRGQQGCVALIVRALQRAGVTFEQRPSDALGSGEAVRRNALIYR
jgi:hypothetical protein